MVTAKQVQNSFDQDVRPACNASVLLVQRLKQFAAGAGDLWAGVNDAEWSDQRDDGPAHLAAKSDWYAFNTYQDKLLQVLTALPEVGTDAEVAALVRALRGQWPIVLKLATRDLTGV